MAEAVFERQQLSEALPIQVNLAQQEFLCILGTLRRHASAWHASPQLRAENVTPKVYSLFHFIIWECCFLVVTVPEKFAMDHETPK